MTTLSVRLDFDASPRAALFGWKSYLRTTSITRSRVAWLMRGWLLSTSETVLSEKPLSLAMSLMVLRFMMPSSVRCAGFLPATPPFIR